MKNEKSLGETVEKLYQVFAPYPLRKHVEGCPCCVHEPDNVALRAKPLRQLSSSDLGRYAYKAMTTWGDADDFRHFLPRIFELLVNNEGIGCEPEIILGKLALAEWLTWPEQEKLALRDLFRTGWNILLFSSAPTAEPDPWLCGLGRAGEDLQPYLEDWLNANDANAYGHLAKFVESHTPTYLKRRSLNNSFWRDSPKAVAQLCDWMTSPQTRESLEKNYFANEPAPFTPALARAIEQLEYIATV